MTMEDQAFDRTFILHCIRKAYETNIDDNGVPPHTDTDSQDSIMLQYCYNEDCTISDLSNNNMQEDTTISTPSLHSDIDEKSYFTDTDMEDSQTDMTDDTLSSTNECDLPMGGDKIPKSFLQLQGISVANFNMACNFHIFTALHIMAQYKLHVLTIQEHTPWSRQLTDGEITSIHRHCDKCGYTAIISKLQILIIDKQLGACHRKTSILEDGRILHFRLEVAPNLFANMFSIYGIPHHGGNKKRYTHEDFEKNEVLQNMATIQSHLKKLIQQSRSKKELIFVFGDLQDTPDSSNDFHYGKCRIPKHPLGIVKLCEDLNLTCTIYDHIHTLEKPIISRHGTKGGRFIDAMYACSTGLQKIIGINLVPDAGINSDHALVINKIDLGIQHFNASAKKEERIDYRKIMNIPVRVKTNADHPILDDQVFKGTEFAMHAKLYQDLQKIMKDPSNTFMNRINAIHKDLKNIERIIIERTMEQITKDEQKIGKLINRIPEDAQKLNNASKAFFQLIHEVCKTAGLASMVTDIPSNLYSKRRSDILQGKNLLATTSFPIARQIDDALKRARCSLQRIGLLLRALRMYTRNSKHCDGKNTTKNSKWIKRIHLNEKRLLRQQQPFTSSISALISLCTEAKAERSRHIEAIEHARNKKIYDSNSKYIDTVINNQGRDEYNDIIEAVKTNVFGRTSNANNTTKHNNSCKLSLLSAQHEQWQQIIGEILDQNHSPTTTKTYKQWYKFAKKGKEKLKQILHTLQQVRQCEWKNSKNYLINIGKYGSIARMINPKYQTGPTASNIFPSKPGEPIRYAINDEERQQASLITHKRWMNDPPGLKNCHFLDATRDEVGINGVEVHPDRIFDEEAEWNYLNGFLEEKTNEQIAEKVRMAHTKLPTLFRQIHKETTLTYPFKYDCEDGKFMHAGLEICLRKNLTCGSGKARATGFGIPVLGRLPKIFFDAYLIKCKIQMTLRLLDTGTECSLRICIGKPCGGVRPLTVGHDDNVFLNGIAQQAIQQEIAKNRVLPETIFSYQKGKGCSDATIIDCIVKETAIQNNDHYVADLSDDAEKMFDRLYIEIQIALLMLAGAGIQGFTEWQTANMVHRTNKLITDIFTALMQYKCGLPQGNGFSVEIANLYAMVLLLWWNMDPINPLGVIAPYTAPRHGYPLIHKNIFKHVASMAYVDDAKRYIAVQKELYSCEHFFRVVQGYCDLMAELSLVIKMGRNVKKCTLILYNIPHDIIVPTFYSTAWSYDAQGPVQGIIEVVVMRRDENNNLICYDVPTTLYKNVPKHVQDILSPNKYLGITNNAQLDSTPGKQKFFSKLSQRIGLISRKTDSIKEARISHNMLVCQVATFSPLCASMTLDECMTIDKQLLVAYQYRLKFLPCDAKHNIFISIRKGGIGVKSYTREYLGALFRDLEVYISNENSLTTHAILSSSEEANKLCMWLLLKAGRIPYNTASIEKAKQSNISGKITYQYLDDPNCPASSYISYDHTHLMERAVRTTCLLGFMLRNLEHEFCSRLADELILMDRNAKTLGNKAISTRASLNACLGKGNNQFYKYSLFGHVYLLLQVIIEEVVMLTANEPNDRERSKLFEDKISRPAIFSKLNCFPKEISAERLATAAKTCIKKQYNDYKIGCFIHLFEWRCRHSHLDIPSPETPHTKTFHEIIGDNNVFSPIVYNTMERNNILLSAHLRKLLCLTSHDPQYILDDVNNLEVNDDDYITSNADIIESITQLNLPAFVSIDASLEGTSATTTINIVIPDVREQDIDMEWQHRPAKTILTRIWKLPSQWGTGDTCINMAEAIGFILGDYTIPQDMPVIYITDSDNARTLQRNISKKSTFTHRQLIRKVKQGIDQAISNHLDFLTSQWPHAETLNAQTLDMYKRGEILCQSWADLHKKQINRMNCAEYDGLDEFDESDTDDDIETDEENATYHQGKNRCRFDNSMYDTLGRVTIVKVYSHQLNEDFSIKNTTKKPAPNIFVVSANQIADNAATYAQRFYSTETLQMPDKLFYPPFSPEWCFSFEGNLINKGASQYFFQKYDEELLLRLQHRPKHGLFARMAHYQCLNHECIGDESLYRDITKMTAMCWTRCNYLNPSLAEKTWKHWRFSLQDDILKRNTPDTLPKGWKNNPMIRNNIIRACPFCDQSPWISKKVGTLEHLHLYCLSSILQGVRNHCNQKIEEVLYKIYNVAAQFEYGCSIQNATRNTKLQDKMIEAAKLAELQERPVVRDSQLIYERRQEHIAIKSRHEVHLLTILYKLPKEKLLEYDDYPFMAQLGLIHAIPEDTFDVATATVIDVCFLGLFPKTIFEALRKYGHNIDSEKKFGNTSRISSAC